MQNNQKITKEQKQFYSLLRIYKDLQRKSARFQNIQNDMILSGQPQEADKINRLAIKITKKANRIKSDLMQNQLVKTGYFHEKLI